MAKVRLIDVAREAGVSVGAASDALAGKNRIPEETRRRVREAADRLGYVPNPVARAMTGGRLPLIAFVVSTIRREAEYLAYRAYWAEMIGAATLAANDRGYGIVVLPAFEGPVADLPFAGAVIVDLVAGDADLNKALERGIPIAADSALDDPRLMIGLDIAYGNSVPYVMDHFLQAGSKRPALLCPDVASVFTFAMNEKYADWCKQHGIAPIASRTEATGDDLHEILGQLLDAGVDAIYSAMPPEPMLQVFQAELNKRGKELGRDIRLVIQEEDLRGDLAARGISTVHFSAMQFLNETIGRLVDAIESPEPKHSQISATFSLLVHNSSR